MKVSYFSPFLLLSSCSLSRVVEGEKKNEMLRGKRVGFKCNSQKREHKSLDINGVLKNAQLQKKILFVFFFLVFHVKYKCHDARIIIENCKDSEEYFCALSD